jgi:hypothetical protein
MHAAGRCGELVANAGVAGSAGFNPAETLSLTHPGVAWLQTFINRFDIPEGEQRRRRSRTRDAISKSHPTRAWRAEETIPGFLS